MKPYYKYLPVDRIDYLESELLRFTQPIDLNDPFECLPGKPSSEEYDRAVEQICQSLYAQTSSSVEKENIKKWASELLTENLYNNANDSVNAEIGILSLSKNWNSTLMWSHYTDCHKGYCIGFNKNHSFFEKYINNNGTKSKILKEVVYSKNRVQIPMDMNAPKLTYEPFITKACGWDYEEEIRVISTLNLSNKNFKGKLCDVHLFKVPFDAIDEIIMGVNISPLNEEKIRKFGIEKNIRVHKCKISDKEFNMERE